MKTSSDLLLGTPLASRLGQDQLEDLARCLRPIRASAGELLVRENDPAHSWYVIAEGSARVWRPDMTGEPVTLATLGPGDSFGEAALTSDARSRSASVTAVTALFAFALDRADFVARVSPASDLDAHLAGQLDVMAIDTALKRASPFAVLPQDALEFLRRRLKPRTLEAGETIIRQGDAGDSLFLIRSGTAQVMTNQRQIAILGSGDSFGEGAVVTGMPRSATVRAIEQMELLELPREDFLDVARAHASLAAFFRELTIARFIGTRNQPLLLPDEVASVTPRIRRGPRKRYWTVLFAGIALFAFLSALAEVSVGPLIVYALTVVGALLVPIAFVQYLAESNLLPLRPVELLATGVLGAALGLPAAYGLQHAAGLVPGSLLASVLIASVEEPAKLLGVLWLVRRHELRFQVDGVLLGAAAGMGFAALETALYGAARLETAGALVGVLWFRALLAPFSHGTWTALVAATFWRTRFENRRITFLALAAVIGLHALWDWSAVPVPLNIVWMLLIGLMSVVFLRIIRQQAVLEEARSVAALAPQVSQATPRSPSVRCGGCGRRAPAAARYCPRCGLALRVGG